MNRSNSGRSIERGASWWALSCVLSGLTALALSGAGLVDATVVEAAPDQLDAADLTVRPEPDRERLAEVSALPCPVYPGACLAPPTKPAPSPAPAPAAPLLDIDCTASGVGASWVSVGADAYRVSYGSAGCLASALPAAIRATAGSPNVLKFQNGDSVSFFHSFSEDNARSYVGQTFTARFYGTLPSGQTVTIEIAGHIDRTP